MCGIAGYYGTRPPSEDRVEACLALMRRRGPDAEGSRSFATPEGRHAVLLHSRLSIIDLDPRAHQPLSREGHTTVFNGEIYNYQELRSAAEAAGATFATSSDTEVLLHEFATRGPDALDGMEGMWAFAMWDEERRILTLSRDRFGEKPLFVHEDESGIYFGSEVKFLAALAGKRFAPNLAQVSRFLVNGYKSLYKGDDTFFEGVREVPPATFVQFDAAGRRTQDRYWAPRHRPDESMTYEQAVEGVRARLLRAVQLRLRADVPLAFCLSGGVDSNALVGAARQAQHDVHGFTIVSADGRYDEAPLVDLVVGRLGLAHTKVPTTSTDFLGRMRELVRYHDAPVYTIADYCKSLLMEAIHEKGYKIAITGAGADEIFSGYYDHHLWYLAQIHGDQARFERYVAAWREHVASVVRNPFLQDPERFVKEPGFRDHIFLHADRFAQHLVHPFHEGFTETRYTDDLLRNRMLNEMFHEAMPVILHDDDLNAMYYSIENRSPFLDRELFEFVYRVPTKHLMRDGYAKALLRDATAGFVPDEVRLEHRKVGFNAPIHDFLDTSDPAVRAELLRDGPIFQVVRKEMIEALLDKKELPNSESKFLFYFLSAKLFLEEFS